MIQANIVLIHKRSNGDGFGATYRFTFLTGIYTTPEEKQDVFKLKLAYDQ